MFVLNDIAIPHVKGETAISVMTALPAAMLLTLALVVCGLMGRVLRERFLRREGMHLHHGEQNMLLAQQCSMPDARGDGAPGVPADCDAFEGAKRRAKLAAFLQPKIGCATSHGIEMMPLEGLPVQLAHRLGSVRRQTLANAPSGGRPQQSSRQRILGTESLQLKSGEMEVIPCSAMPGTAAQLLLSSLDGSSLDGVGPHVPGCHRCATDANCMCLPTCLRQSSSCLPPRNLHCTATPFY